MRNGLKLALALALACGVGVGVGACGGGGDSSDGSGTDTGSSKLSGTVTVWDFEYGSFPGYKKAADKIDAEFESLHPGVEVDRVAQPVATYESIARAAFVANEGPDVMLMQPGTLGVLSFTKGLEVLNDRISPEMQDSLGLWQSVTPGFAAEGDRYAVPIGLQGTIFYYNKKLFAKAGLPTDFEPKSWEEVKQAGEKLQAAGIQPFTGGNKEGGENQKWFEAGWVSVNSPEQAIELAEGELPYTDEAVSRALEPEIMMQEAGLNPADYFSTPLFPDGATLFSEGKGAMYLGFWNTAGYWGEFNPALGEENVGMFFPPGSSSVWSYPSIALSIPTFADNKDAAWALIEYTASKEGTETLYNPGGYLPNRSDVQLPADAPAQARELVEAAQGSEAVIGPLVLVPPSVLFGPLATEVSEVLQDRTSLESAQQAMQETAEKSAG